jgi:hypothetical protein
LKPLEALLPLAFSNFLPLDLVYGLAEDPGTPGAPKCLTASLVQLIFMSELIFWGKCTVDHEARVYWFQLDNEERVDQKSNIHHRLLFFNFIVEYNLPFVILARAVFVNLRAQTDIF